MSVNRYEKPNANNDRNKTINLPFSMAFDIAVEAGKRLQFKKVNHYDFLYLMNFYSY